MYQTWQWCWQYVSNGISKKWPERPANIILQMRLVCCAPPQSVVQRIFLQEATVHKNMHQFPTRKHLYWREPPDVINSAFYKRSSIWTPSGNCKQLMLVNGSGSGCLRPCDFQRPGTIVWVGKVESQHFVNTLDKNPAQILGFLALCGWFFLQTDLELDLQ